MFFSLIDWAWKLVTGQPHFVIGDPENPYLIRRWLIPRNPWFNVYLHCFLRDDIDRALHDHPWASLSLVLRGGCWEVYESEDGSGSRLRRLHPWQWVYRPATFQHRIMLFANSDGSLRQCWTLFITGPKVREWGFWCPKGFVPWFDFVDRENTGEVGAGCGEGE